MSGKDRFEAVDESRRSIVKAALAAAAVTVPVVTTLPLGGQAAFADSPDVSGQTTTSRPTTTPAPGRTNSPSSTSDPATGGQTPEPTSSETVTPEPTSTETVTPEPTTTTASPTTTTTTTTTTPEPTSTTPVI